MSIINRTRLWESYTWWQTVRFDVSGITDRQKAVANAVLRFLVDQLDMDPTKAPDRDRNFEDVYAAEQDARVKYANDEQWEAPDWHDADSGPAGGVRK